MGYVVSVETTGHLVITDTSRFDLQGRQGKIEVDGLRFTSEKGQIVEVTATGRVYKQDGTQGKSWGQSEVSPPGASFDPEVFDAAWDHLPSRVQHEIRTALGVLA